MDMRGRDYISDLDFSKEETEYVLELAWELKKKRSNGVEHALLRDKVLAMLFVAVMHTIRPASKPSLACAIRNCEALACREELSRVERQFGFL